MVSEGKGCYTLGQAIITGRLIEKSNYTAKIFTLSEKVRIGRISDVARRTVENFVFYIA